MGKPRQLNFDAAIKFAKTATLEKVHAVRTDTHAKLRELRVKRDKSKAVAKVPNASDDLSVGGLRLWIQNVPADNQAEVAKLVAFDATLVSRG